MVDEQTFMKDLYKTIVEGTDLYHADDPYADLSNSDPEKIYKYIMCL